MHRCLTERWSRQTHCWLQHSGNICVLTFDAHWRFLREVVRSFERTNSSNSSLVNWKRTWLIISIAAIFEFLVNRLTTNLFRYFLSLSRGVIAVIMIIAITATAILIYLCLSYFNNWIFEFCAYPKHIFLSFLFFFILSFRCLLCIFITSNTIIPYWSNIRYYYHHIPLHILHLFSFSFISLIFSCRKCP